jgi:hypothetical protein
VHQCPCCGYRTLPGRGDYDLCPVCSWEDEAVEPWEYSDANGQTLVEAQQEFLADTRPYRGREGKARPPKRREARDPGWRPYELTDDLVARMRQAKEDRERYWEEERRRVAHDVAVDPEGPFKEYNVDLRLLIAEAAGLPHRVVKARMRELGRKHDFELPEAYVQLQSRVANDEGFYRRHPLQAAWWLLRHARPGTYKRRWRELRAGTFTFVG